MSSLRMTGAVLAAAGIFAAACKSERPATGSDAAPATASDSAGAAPAVVTIAANDFSFEAPAQIPGGVTRFRLTNGGTELHQAQMVRLKDGKTAADLAQALKKPGPLPSWIEFTGGPNGIAPGQEANATGALAPGQYAYICLIPSPDGVMHAAKGMIRPFEVTAASSDTPTELPKSDLTIKLLDHDFQHPPLVPGKHTILVENAGPQPHELVLVRMAPGKKVEDFAHWAEGGLKGQPPAEALGGVVVLERGGQGTFDVELTPGDYGLICFVPDSKDGKPHLAHGMMKTIRVGEG